MLLNAYAPFSPPARPRNPVRIAAPPDHEIPALEITPGVFTPEDPEYSR